MSTFIIGINLGMLLFLLAAGLTLIFGMLGVFNFAHGSLYMLGAYMAYQIVHLTGSFWVALALSPLIICIVGAGMELVMRLVYKRAHLYPLLVLFGAVYVLEEVVRLVWGVYYVEVAPPALLNQPVMLLGSSISSYRIFIIGFGAIASLLLFLVLEKTRLGMVLRAASSKEQMAACLGIDVPKVRTVVFAIGAGLAALGGVIAAPLIPVDPSMGITILIDCFIVVVIGGLGNVRGAIFGALLIGMIRAFGQYYVPDLIDVLVYLVFGITLLWRPEGFFSRRKRLA
jgi:branched-chain amino acid transport system permease protein